MSEPFRFEFGSEGGTESKPMDTGKSDVPASAPNAAASEATAHIEAVRSKRGRPPRDDAKSVADRERIREELTREFATLFAPEYWEGIVRGPADLMLAVSKRELWNVPDKELKPLAMGAAHTARLFLQTDPKWIALFMFSVSLTQVYGARFAIHIAQMRKEERERKERGSQDQPLHKNV